MIPHALAHWLRPRVVPHMHPIPALAEQLREECEAMARYALHHGLPVAPELIAQLGDLIDRQMPARATPHHALAAIHRKLAAAIAPATPQAVTLLDAQHRSDHPFAWLGPVPLIRLLTSAAIAFLIAVIATGMSPDVSSANIDRGFLQSDGTRLLWNTLFLLFCAGLGASFATLFQAHRYVAASTYDPKYDASYGARLILGVIAGLILVEMLPAQLFDRGSMHNFGKPALAMLGGFSATAVHRLLQRLVDALETLVRGDRSADADAAMQTYRARAASERTQWQSELAANLIDLQQSFDSTASPEAIRQRLADFTRAMLAASDPAASSPPPPDHSRSDPMLFLYNIPAWAMGALIVFATLFLALGGYVLFRRFFPITLDAEQRSMTIAMMTAVTTINSLLVAFSAISVWGAYQAAADIVAAEAACATELARDLSAFSHPSATTARRELVTYLEHVVHDEWPSMQQHAQPDADTETVFNRMFATANRITPRDDRERVLLIEVLARVNEMVKYREKRLQNLEAAMPGTLWGVMLIASGLSLLLLYALPATRFHMALVAVWAITLGLAFFFVLAVDRPFAGEVSVSAAPLDRAIQTLSNDKPQTNPLPPPN